MDRHAMMWNEATRDIDAEKAERALAYALAEATVRTIAGRHGTTVDTVQAALDASFGHVLTARKTAAARVAKTAAATPPPPVPEPPSQAPQPPTTAPGAPADLLTDSATAKTSKPRTLPAGGAPAPAPMPPMPTGPSAPTAGTAPTGAQATPPRTASRRQVIEADIAALNPHLPPATITRLASAALRHLDAARTRHTAAEPLAYGNWENPDDGPITRSVKNWQPGGKKTPAGGASGGEGSGGPDGAPDPAPAGPAAAADVAEEALPLLAAASRR